MTYLAAAPHLARTERDWLTRKEAAIYLSRLGCPISPGTLANMAANNNARRGPPFTRFRWNRVGYLKTDLDVWHRMQVVRIA